MDIATLISRLDAATTSFHTLERQLADPDVASDPKRLQSIARERSRLEPLVQDYQSLQQVKDERQQAETLLKDCLLYTSPSPRDRQKSRMPSSA